MGWLTYYHLLEKYNGEILKATKEEMNFAFRDNPNTPPEARALAEKKWEEENCPRGLANEIREKTKQPKN